MSGPTRAHNAPATRAPAGRTVTSRPHVPPSASGNRADAVLNMQRLAGNRAVTQLIASRGTSVLGSRGRPLDASVRGRMEDRFNHDFSDVRVHTDPAAAQSASAISAQAYTVGRDIVFSEGRFAPQGSEGQRLLAHELAHVVQQDLRGSGASIARTEAEAGRASSTVMAGGTPVIAASAPAGVVQRAPEDENDKSILGRVWGAARDKAKAAEKGAVALVERKLASDKEAANIFKLGEEGVKQDLDKLEAKANEGNQKWVEQTKDSPVLNKVARASAAVNKFSTEFSVGAVKAGVGMIGGLAQVTMNPVGTIKDMAVNTKQGPIELAADQAALELKQAGKDALEGKVGGPAGAFKAMDRVGMAAGQGVLNKVEQVEPLIEGYVEAARKGKYGEIPGRAFVDIGSFFIGGGGGAAAKGGGLGKAAQLSKAGKVGEIAKVAEGAKIGEAAKGVEAAKGFEAAKVGDLGKAGAASRSGSFASAITRLPGVKSILNTARAGMTRAMMGVSEALPFAERVSGGATFVPAPATALADIGEAGSAMTRSPGAKIVPTAASKGSRVSSILQQVAKGPEVFGELARELGMEAPAARAPQTKAAAVAQAVREGEPLARVVDLTAVPYDYASAARRELGITGAQAEAAHHGPTAMLKNIPGYSRGQSLTTLLPRAVHRAFDAPWKRWWASGARTNPNLGWLQKYQQVERAAMQTPGLTARARATLAWLAFQDFAKGEIALAEAGRASAATDISGTARASAPAAATPAAALPAAATPVAAAPAAAAPASVAASAAGPATVSSALDASAAAKPRIAMPANVAGAADVAPGANARIANPAEAAHTPPAAQGGPRVSVPVEEAPEALLEDAAESPAARQQQMVLPDPLKRKLK